jgi:hypothetical protein
MKVIHSVWCAHIAIMAHKKRKFYALSVLIRQCLVTRRESVWSSLLNRGLHSVQTVNCARLCLAQSARFMLTEGEIGFMGDVVLVRTDGW